MLIKIKDLDHNKDAYINTDKIEAIYPFDNYSFRVFLENRSLVINDADCLKLELLMNDNSTQTKIVIDKIRKILKSDVELTRESAINVHTFVESLLGDLVGDYQNTNNHSQLKQDRELIYDLAHWLAHVLGQEY